MVVFKNTVKKENRPGALTTEAVKSTSLSLKSIDNVHSGHCLATSVLRVSDSVTDDILQKDLEHAASLLVDETADTLHASTARETSDGWLGDALDVITEHLPVPLRTSLPEPLPSFSPSRHGDSESLKNTKRRSRLQ
jgi:hypothetical protein